MALPLPPPSLLLQPPVTAAVAISKCGSGRRVDRGFPHCPGPWLLPQQSRDLGLGPEWEPWPPPPDTSHCVSGWRWAEAGAAPPRLPAPEGVGRPRSSQGQVLLRPKSAVLVRSRSNTRLSAGNLAVLPAFVGRPVAVDPLNGAGLKSCWCAMGVSHHSGGLSFQQSL